MDGGEVYLELNCNNHCFKLELTVRDEIVAN